MIPRAHVSFFVVFESLLLMASNARFYDISPNRSTLDSSLYNSSLRNFNATNQERENRRTAMQEHEHNEDLVLKLTEEIKKTVKEESMETVVTGLRKEVTELRTELGALKDSEETSRFGVRKQGKLPKMLLVSNSLQNFLFMFREYCD